MPFDIAQISERALLFDCFLYVVFAESPLSQCVDQPNRLRWKSLGDRQQFHAVAIAAHCLRRGGDSRVRSLPRLLVVAHNRPAQKVGSETTFADRGSTLVKNRKVVSDPTFYSGTRIALHLPVVLPRCGRRSRTAGII